MSGLTAFKMIQHSRRALLPLNSWKGSGAPLSLTIQQESNARINPRRAQAFNVHQRKQHEKNAIEASG
jgi:hypothetical protein